MHAIRFMLLSVAAAVLIACGTPTSSNDPQTASAETPAVVATAPTAVATAAPTAVAIAPTAVAKLVPGDRVGDVVLTTIAQPDPTIPAMTDPCNSQNTGEPGVYTFTCSVAASPNLWLGLGWSNPPDKLEDDWKNITWQAYLEDRELDLPAFGTFDIPITGSDHKLRGWTVAIADPVPRIYTLRMVSTVKNEMSGAKPGTYDFTYKITVTK